MIVSSGEIEVRVTIDLCQNVFLVKKMPDK